MSDSPRYFDRAASATAKFLRPYPWLYASLRVPWRRFLAMRGMARRSQSRYLVSQRARMIRAMESQVKLHEERRPKNDRPVVFFSASARTSDIGFCALAGLVTSWGLRLAGERVVNFVCRGGLTRCMAGTNLQFPDAESPCQSCWETSRVLFDMDETVPFGPVPGSSGRLLDGVQGLDLGQLSTYTYKGIPVGRLSLPSLRWAMRRHNLDDTPVRRSLYAGYVSSAASLVDHFERFIDEVQPKALLAFNGTSFPEAVAREVALSKSVPVVTYEVGHRNCSLFFSHGVATQYAIDIPQGFELGPDTQRDVEDYLKRRFAGDVYMGGVKFWPEMKQISVELKSKASAFEQVVSIFTNVVFDTSQAAAHTIFNSMFEWLDTLAEVVKDHPGTLFIVRAHPDELRPGKQSQEPVEKWFAERGLLALENVVFVPPGQHTSSYDLVRLSKLCLIYNSTIGLEATILGTPVLCAAKTKYAREGVTHNPETKDEYRRMLGQFLSAPSIEMPVDWQSKARRFLYYTVFKASLDFSPYIRWSPQVPGYLLKRFPVEDLATERSKEMAIIHDGIVNGKDFCYG